MTELPNNAEHVQAEHTATLTKTDTFYMVAGSLLITISGSLPEYAMNEMQVEAADNPESSFTAINIPGSSEKVHITENPEYLGVAAGGVFLLALGAACIAKVFRNRSKK